MPRRRPTTRNRDGKLSRETDRARGTAHERGYGARWQRVRKQYLGAHPLCVFCRDAGKVTPATDVDHVVPLRDGGAHYDWSNLRSLCHSCHSKHTNRSGA